MNYEQALEYIHTRNKFGKKAGLENIALLLEKMGNPHKKLKFIHVAGTNGKGSTTSMIASVLEKSGLKVGKFISPYVIEFGERVQVNGEMISHEELVEVVSFIKPFAEEMSAEDKAPVEFEMVTAIGLEYFSRKNCDVVVLEVGIGGTYDTTNVIDPPLVSVITSISYDHVNILGDTLAKIASEKAGIIKNPSPAVCYVNQPEEALEVVKKTASDNGCDLRIGDTTKLLVNSTSLEGSDIIYKDLEIHIPLSGYHQIENCITVVETLLLLKERYGYNITDENIISGISSVRFPARMEILKREPLVILDGAHNQSGIETVYNNLKQLGERRYNLIIGMLSDKDFSESLYSLCREAREVYTVRPPSPRAVEADELASMLSEKGIKATPYDDLSKAYGTCLENTSKEDVLMICGSLYLAGDIREIIINWEK